MSMNSKQRWMGGVVLLGGGVLLAALLLKGKEEIDQKHVQVPQLNKYNNNVKILLTKIWFSYNL